MRCINEFRELMNHEFPEFSHINVARQGYKVDGEGIKKNCGLSTLKSVDYYEDNAKHGFLFVEFSDLARQDDYLNARLEKINSSTMCPNEKRRLRKEFYKTINKELCQKFKDSIIILNNLDKHFLNIPESFSNTTKYVIVVPNISPELGDQKKIDVTRFLDTLKDKVAASIPACLFHSVKILRLEQFI